MVVASNGKSISEIWRTWKRLRTPAMAAKRWKSQANASDCESYERLGASKKHLLDCGAAGTCCAHGRRVNTGIDHHSDCRCPGRSAGQRWKARYDLGRAASGDVSDLRRRQNLEKKAETDSGPCARKICEAVLTPDSQSCSKRANHGVRSELSNEPADMEFRGSAVLLAGTVGLICSAARASRARTIRKKKRRGRAAKAQLQL